MGEPPYIDECIIYTINSLILKNILKTNPTHPLSEYVNFVNLITPTFIVRRF
jgi:hypothetical protein